MERVERLNWLLALELERAGQECALTGEPVRVLQNFRYRTLLCRSHKRHVIGMRSRVSVRTVRLSFGECRPEAGLFRQVLVRQQKLPLLC